MLGSRHNCSGERDGVQEVNVRLLISSTFVCHLLAEIRDATPLPTWVRGAGLLGGSGEPGLRARRTARRPPALGAGMARAWLSRHGGPLG